MVPRAPELASIPAHSSAVHTPIRLLFVEDHDATRRAMEHLLRQRGFAVRSAASVVEAKSLTDEFSFDLVISDLGLPDASGLELMNFLRVKYPGLIGIALTAYSSEADYAQTRAAGFAAHLVKPISIRELEPAIRAVLGTR